MSFGQEEVERRRVLREELRQKRQQEQQNLIKRLTYAGVALAVAAVIILAVVLIGNADGKKPVDTRPTETVVKETEPKGEQTVVHFAAAGDLNITDKVVSSGGAGMDYSRVFADVLPLLAEADLTVMNLEGNVVGAPYGTQQASAPAQLLSVLATAGVDMVQMANSYAVHNGISGLTTTLSNLRSAGMEPLGAFSTEEEYRQSQGFTICNIGGIRVAFVAFTKGVGSLGLPQGNEHCVNLLYKDYTTTYRQIDKEGIRQVLQAVQDQQPDVTIALLHWGSEYNNNISQSQRDIAELMLEQGVDAIIGNHSHYVQQVDYHAQEGKLVAYSLGDFYGDAQKAGTNYSILLQLEITRDNYTGQTRITGWDYVPIYTLTPERDGMPMQVVRLQDAIDRYESNHVDRVTPQAYENMKAALERIRSRVGDNG